MSTPRYLTVLSTLELICMVQRLSKQMIDNGAWTTRTELNH